MDRLIVKKGNIRVAPILLSLLIFAIILFLSINQYSKELKFVDIFSILTGTSALILTGYQIIYSITEKDKIEANQEIVETRSLLLSEIHEVSEICKNEFDNQTSIVNSLVRKITELTIEIRTHSNSVGHDSGIELFLKMQQELMDLKSDIDQLTRQDEILSRLSLIESTLGKNNK